MGSIRARTLVVMALMVAAVSPLAARAADSAEPASVEAIESQIKEARVQLDEAARKLAELHTQLWQVETRGPGADRPMLGILIQDAGTEAGLTLAGVTPEGGAERAGLMAGDTIVEVAGISLTGGEQKPLSALRDAMSSVAPGETVAVSYVRDGETYQAEVETRARGEYMARMVEEKGPWLESLRSLGNLEDLEALQDLEELEVLKTLDDEVVQKVIVRSPAGLRLDHVRGELAGYFGVESGVLVLEAPVREPTLKAGDVLLSLGGEPVADVSSALRRLAGASGELEARIKRHGEELDVVLDADAMNAERSLSVLGGDRRVMVHGAGEGGRVRLEIVVDDD